MTSNRKDVRIKRATADNLFEGLKRMIIEVNTSDNFNYRIDKAILFGSYVNSNSDTVGDLDVAISLKPKWESEKQREKDDIKSKECKSNDFLSCLFWPQTEVKRYIKNRSAYISIHTLELTRKLFSIKTTLNCLWIDVCPHKLYSYNIICK